MHGSTRTRTKNGRTYRYPKYVCSGYSTTGAGEGRCGCHAVDQSLLLDYLLGELKRLILSSGKRESLRDEILATLQASADSSPGKVDSLKATLVKLEKGLEHAKRRFLKAPDDIADMLAEELSAMRKQRDDVAAELKAAEAAECPRHLDEQADAVADRLWSIGHELENAQPARMRHLLGEMVDRVDLYFDRVQRGKRTECPISKGVATLRHIPGMLGCDNRGDRI